MNTSPQRTSSRALTDQEQFWASDFGDEYTDRNQGADLLRGRIRLFDSVIRRTGLVGSIIEFGANIGLNLRAIRSLMPNVELSAVEINAKAAAELEESPEIARVYQQSLLDWQLDYQREMAFVCGVLIHLDPKCLPRVYDLLDKTANRYVVIAEYYNPTPVEVPYRGHTGKLFKRDFAGEFLDRFPGTRLVDYGFVYHLDPISPLDDITWFLIRK